MFNSHEDKTMLRHLEEVRQNARFLAKDKYDEPLDIMCCCHDFGKYTTYFQTYLKDKKKNKYANHGFISAMFSAYIAMEKYGQESLLPLIIYNDILHHHGNLKYAAEDLPVNLRQGLYKIMDSDLFEKVTIAQKQIENIKNNRNEIVEDYRALGYERYFNEFIDGADLPGLLKKLKRMEYVNLRKLEEPEVYFQSQFMYSALIGADKLSASNTKIPEEKYAVFENLNLAREDKLKGADNSKLNNIRKEIFLSIQDNLEKVYKDNKIFSISAPTGTGKTYSGFFAALKLKELLGDGRRIIYALPFTSIIDQNFNVVEKLFKHVEDFVVNRSKYIIKHHSMAQLEYDDEFEDYSVSQSKLLLENWSSGIVITTFVQLLQTLIGNSNRMLKKFNAFENSIILLDEVQAIDIEYYSLVDYVLRAAADKLNCRVIMMTATKPLILKDACELLNSYERYFQMFDRTEIIPRLQPVTINEFAEEFIEQMEQKSYLIICNTINQSLEIYNQLKDVGREVYYLSTNLIPKHRKEVIDKVSSALSLGEKPILVSTQVVEAGVDFDFDVVIRDIAPIDSIIQAAGRCNRNSKQSSRGKVCIYMMKSESEKYFSNLVYGHSSINITEELLKNKVSIPENNYLELIKEYFTQVTECKNDDASKGFIDSLNKLVFTDENMKWEYSLDKFSLIKEKSNYVDVFMRCCEEAEEIYQEFIKTMSEKESEERMEKLLNMRRNINEYTLSLPIRIVKDRVSSDKTTVLLNMSEEACDSYYDKTTGFKRSEDDYLVF
ncbi:CRISPR-associated helicase/endonuclease Cas3 [Clostridium oryzae]|uniref:CRISPR-associated nuclease/helicase Cas3 n=1 Tax=Clostridium oryzae TaxID=1450648 RepID=A0A1V4IQ63_9CLOT|nr:CRISPR-associated helicase/endonuclease Cas3 [Clostridium oryzae]OPJ62162.1 CRISPR-associated nuclease/helicase Cas3 [Clostridium oryzae]